MPRDPSPSPGREDGQDRVALVALVAEGRAAGVGEAALEGARERSEAEGDGDAAPGVEGRDVGQHEGQLGKVAVEGRASGPLFEDVNG